MYKSIFGVVVIIETLILTTPAEAVITFSRTYGGTDYGDCSAQETQDGGYIIAGYTGDIELDENFCLIYGIDDLDDEDVYLIKTDAVGNTVRIIDTLWDLFK